MSKSIPFDSSSAVLLYKRLYKHIIHTSGFNVIPKIVQNPVAFVITLLYELQPICFMRFFAVGSE